MTTHGPTHGPTQAPTHGPTPERFFSVISAYQQSAALKAGIDLKIFTAIGEGHNTAAKLAASCHIAERGARILADYLTILGFLKKSAEHARAAGGEGSAVYTLAEDAALFLDRNSPMFLGNAVDFLCSPTMRAHFDDVGQRVREGGAARDGDNSLAPNHEMWVHFARGMAGLMTMPAQMMARQVLAEAGAGNGGGKPMKVLDIAAGHGMYGIAFAQQNPQAHVIALDWAPVLTVAMENARKFGVADRVASLAGSAFEVDFGAGFDVILLPNFLHHFDVATNVKLLKKVHAAVKPGGIAAALEFAPDANRVNPPGAGAFALVMLVSTPSGDAYTVDELREMYAQAGFRKFQVAPQPVGMQRLVTGVK